MARNKGVASLGFNFQVEAAAPLDTRTVVQNLTDLTSESTWLKDGNLYIYEGMEVYVEETKNKYLLTDPTNYNNITSWKNTGSGGGSSTFESEHVELTQAQYDALTTEEKNNGKVYFVNETTGSTTKGKIYKNGIMYNDLGTVTGNYTAGQGIRITNDVIDTPLLDKAYTRASSDDGGKIIRYLDFQLTDSDTRLMVASYCTYPSNGEVVYTPNSYSQANTWEFDAFMVASIMNFNQANQETPTSTASKIRIAYISKDGQNWEPLQGWSIKNNNAYYPTNSGYQYSYGIVYVNGSTTRPTNTNSGTYYALKLVEYETTYDKVHQVSGVVRDDYADEMISGLTEQDVHDAVEGAFAQGAVNINEQYSVGEEVLIGTWKQNSVVYDLYRKVIDFGALPNATTKSVAHGISNLLNCVHVSIKPSYRTTSLIYDDSFSGNSTGGFLRFEADNTNLKCTSSADKSAWTAKVVIEFTKARG